MKEKRAIFAIDILKNIINVYFDTFFVFYFFKVANYEVLPLAKYYLTLYLSIGIAFFLIRNVMKKNIKVPYFRIGISLQALYISMIMLMKDNIINHIYLVGLMKGFADGFYHFPKNILNSEKISNEDRQKFSGKINTINKISSIIIPLIMGVALTFIDYVNLGKIFFVLFIILFVLSFAIKDERFNIKKSDLKGFFKLLKNKPNLKSIFLIPFLTGFTYSSGVMGLIITLLKINNFKTNLYLGIVDSICAFISLVVCIIFTYKLKKEKFKPVLLVTGILCFIVLIVQSIWNNIFMLIAYLIVRFSCMLIINLISDNVLNNLSNIVEIKQDYKSEYYLLIDIIYSISRSLGYLLLFIICLTLGMDYIQYLLILPAISILIQTFIVRKLVKLI